MSRENVEVVRRICEGWASGDFGVEADALDAHVVLVVPPEFPEFGVFAGPSGIATYMRRFLEQFERVTIEAEQIEAVGDTVLVRLIQHGKYRVSGLEGDNRYFILFTFRGKRIVRIENALHENEALEAAGLSEQDAHADS